MGQNNTMRLWCYVIIAILWFMPMSCDVPFIKGLYDEIPIDPSSLAASDIRVFQRTRAWDLAKAVRDGDISLMRSIAGEDSTIINVRDPVYGSTLLMHAVWVNNLAAFQLLLDFGADSSPCLSINGYHVMAVASKVLYGYPFVKALLDQGVDPNSTTCLHINGGVETNDTPLTVASFAGVDSVVRLLIERGCNVDWVDPQGTSALESAAFSANYSIILMLLNAGCDFRRPFPSYDPLEPGKKVGILYSLRKKIESIGSNEYREKMKVVEWLADHGYDYRTSPLPDGIEDRIRVLYPDSVEYYLKHY
jgi:Ankyrin repeats (3 copies)